MRQQNSLTNSAAATRLARAYRDALLAGDSRRAEQTVRDLLTVGLDPAEMYLEVFAPALEAVGTLWQQGAITVAEEHLATAITERMMGLVRPLFAPPVAANEAPEPPARPVLLVGCVAGEQHRIGAQMVADVFLRGGWDVLFLGADCPTTDLVRLATTRRPDLVALSATIDAHLPAVRDAVARLQSAPATRGVPILVGGAPFVENPALADEVGADMVARSPLEALALATALLDGDDESLISSAAVAAISDEPAPVWAPVPDEKVGGVLMNGSGADHAPVLPVPVPDTSAELVSPGVVFVLDRDGRIRWANEAGLLLAGNDAAPVIGRAFAGLTDNYSREKVMRLLARTGTGETVVDFEINHVVPHHNAPIVLISYTAFAMPDGTVTLVGRDLAQRVDAIASLSQVNQKLEGMVSDLVQERTRLEAQAAAFADVRRRLEKQWQSERRVAVALQKSFLGDVPNALPGIEVAYRYHPAQADTHVGGDFYDVYPVDPDHVAVVIADVSGKGLRAALATVMVKYTLRAYAAEDPTPSSVLGRFNRFVCDHGDIDGFITVFYALLNIRTGALLWGSAGHEPTLLVRPAAAGQGTAHDIRMLTDTSLVAGALPDTVYRDNAAHLTAGDFFVAYTDGIIDARGGDGELYGEERVEAAVRARLGVPVPAVDAERIVAALYDDVTAHSAGRLADDATLLVVRRTAVV
jgi:serine phosphatase RsbU (regulator of sigma subunit)/methanogenic corrinoid protein MtbC1